MNRAFVALEIKALDEDARQIEGWATTPDVDRMGDIVLPKGAEFKLPIPFLLDHDHSQVVGEVDSVDVSDKGIKFVAHIKKIAEDGPAKELVDKAWSFIKNGLRKAVSIGFMPKEFDVLPNGGLKFTSWEWYELSAVGIPAQPGAVITGTKSYSLGDKYVAEDAGELDWHSCRLSAADADQFRRNLSSAFRAFPEIPSEPEMPPEGKKAIVVRLGADAQDRAPPFQITKIHKERKP